LRKKNVWETVEKKGCGEMAAFEVGRHQERGFPNGDCLKCRRTGTARPAGREDTKSDDLAASALRELKRHKGDRGQKIKPRGKKIEDGP